MENSLMFGLKKPKYFFFFKLELAIKKDEQDENPLNKVQKSTLIELSDG